MAFRSFVFGGGGVIIHAKVKQFCHCSYRIRSCRLRSRLEYKNIQNLLPVFNYQRGIILSRDLTFRGLKFGGLSFRELETSDPLKMIEIFVRIAVLHE